MNTLHQDLSRMSETEVADLFVAVVERLANRTDESIPVNRLTKNAKVRLAIAMIIQACKSLGNMSTEERKPYLMMAALAGVIHAPADITSEFVNRDFFFQFINDILTRSMPLIRDGAAPKKGRNEIVHKCLTVDGLSKKQTYRYLAEHHPKLLQIGVGKTATPASVWAGYNKWRRAAQDKAR